MSGEGHDAREPDSAEHSRREVLRIGAVAGAVAAGTLIFGANAPAYAAKTGKSISAASFRVALDGALVRKVQRVSFQRQVHAVLETPAGNSYTFEPLAFGDLDVLVSMSEAEATLTAWKAWFEQVRTASDSGDPRTLLVESLSADLSTVLRTWQLLVRPKRYERVVPEGKEAMIENRFLLRGSMGPSRP